MSESKVEWLQRVADMHGLDPEDIGEIAEMCLEDTDVHVECLQAAKPGIDLSEAVRAAHSLKGSAGNIGQGDISKVASILENQLKVDNFDSYEKNLEDLKETINAFKILMSS